MTVTVHLVHNWQQMYNNVVMGRVDAIICVLYTHLSWKTLFSLYLISCMSHHQSPSLRLKQEVFSPVQQVDYP